MHTVNYTCNQLFTGHHSRRRRGSIVVSCVSCQVDHRAAYLSISEKSTSAQASSFDGWVVVGGVVQWRARDGTIAADTDSYPFGTRMFVPDWGWGVVEDRGGAIQVKTNELRDEM